KLTKVIDGTNLGTWEWDILSDEVKVNEHFASMIGQSLKESDITTIDSLNKFINPVDLESSKRVMGKHLDGDTEYYDFEMRMKHKNGQWVWIHNIGKVILRNEQGKPIKLFGTFSDITARKEAEKNLKESEERFLLALDETKAGLWDMDMMSKEMFLSPMLKKILGYEDEEVENTIDALNSLCHPDDIQKLYDAGQDYLKGRINSYEMVHRLKHKDGKWRWILTRGGVLKDDHGQPIRWIATNIDVTAEYEQSLELERFFSINLDLLSIMDSNGTFIKINKAWEEKFGCSSSEIEGQRYDKFIHPDDLARTEESSVNLRQEGVVKNFTNRYLCADGQYHYFEWKANQYGDVIYAAARDITERIHYENKILDLSHRDVLTNIYNRRFIYEKAEKILGESRKVNKDFSIAILDLDEFKLINDGYGHQIGDCVLKEFTKIVGDNLKEETLLGRYGGEEFILIFENSSIHDSEGTMQNILQMIRKNLFKYDDIEINLTFSAGISSSSEIDKEMMGIDE
ncbi:MAG: PAS domain-containing protein, partial [Clostridium sp.]|nr:PAS domain-containing protein [Clostridium sp.]